jgi:hypothetical protein
MSRAGRWVAGLLLMVAIWLGIGLLLVELSVTRWLAGAIGLLVAVSIVEPQSYLRQGLQRIRAARQRSSA